MKPYVVIVDYEQYGMGEQPSGNFVYIVNAQDKESATKVAVAKFESYYTKDELERIGYGSQVKELDLGCLLKTEPTLIYDNVVIY